MPVTPCINEALPAEVFGVIFEEHAKLEWRAPVIDGLVCRQWRQTILHTPRAWAHLEIGDNFRSLPSELRQQWLGRSGMAPLHIRVSYLGGVAEILDQHYKRFESLAVYHSIVHSLLENRSFPILQSLTVYGPDIYSGVFRFSNWGAMPALRSLRVCGIPVDILPSKAVPAWRVLALCRVKEYEHIVKNSYHSLTTLMLDGRDAPNTPETLEFPSLSFLSLFAVGNLKHRMRVPALTTYHEASAKTESFSMILPLLTEYGISQINMQPLFNIIVTRLHYCYPNLSRFSVRSCPSFVKAFVHSLRRLPTSLPMLRILAVEISYGEKQFSRQDRDRMMNDVFVRNTAASVKMELCFDGRLRVPLYFANDVDRPV